DMVFVTVSSGIGGGLVVGGRLLRGARGLAGSLGQTLRGKGDGLLRLEALASGFGIAEAARVAGHPGDAKSVIAAANDHVPWANDILAGVASELAAALVGVQAMVDPDCIVIGGGVGLAHGFIARLERAFETLPEALVPI
ncbi:ROK family protein, partial [Pseudomonas sp. Fl4BN2]|nr:ROK family protein [Pseudomonas sp. Fl4BN2]